MVHLKDCMIHKDIVYENVMNAAAVRKKGARRHQLFIPTSQWPFYVILCSTRWGKLIDTFIDKSGRYC